MMASILFWLLTATTLLTLTVHALILAGQTLKIPRLEFYGRTLASYTALFLCAFYGTVSSALLNAVGYGGLGQWTTARAFKWTMLLFTGLWFEIEDEKNWLNTTRPAVIVGNHQTELDVLVLGHIFPKYCSVTAKKSLSYVPFLGWFMTLSKTVFIERTSRTQAFAAFSKAAEQMQRAKQSVYIFPEGTRSYYDHPDLLPFKKGAFHLAIQAQVPIVPIVVANYSNVLSPKKKIFRPGSIPIKVLQPIQTGGKTKDDVDALMEETRDKMLEALKEITVKARQHGISSKQGETSGSTAPRTSGSIDIAKA